MVSLPSLPASSQAQPEPNNFTGEKLASFHGNLSNGLENIAVNQRQTLSSRRDNDSREKADVEERTKRPSTSAYSLTSPLGKAGLLSI